MFPSGEARGSVGNPAPEIAHALATTDRATLGHTELIDAITASERLIAWAQAHQYALIAQLAAAAHDAPTPQSDIATRDLVDAEIGLALTLSTRAAGARVTEAGLLNGPLRATRDLLAAGQIDPARARLICSTLDELDTHDTMIAAQDRVLPEAPTQMWAQLRAALRRAVLAVDTRNTPERHRAATATRRVDVYPDRDGMATFWARLSAVDAASCYSWITRLARGVSTDTGHRGSIDNRRADVMVALLTGRLRFTTEDPSPEDPSPDSPDTGDDGQNSSANPGSAGGSHRAGSSPDGSRSDSGTADGADATRGGQLWTRPVGADRPLVHITVPFHTLTGGATEPAELHGYGPLPAHIARDIAAHPDSTWRRLLVDPHSGTLLDHGRTTYRPPAGLAAHVRARDGQCRHPTCGRTAHACELDHVVPWTNGGSTNPANLASLCTRHHTLKHHPGWRVTLHPDHTLEWITPTGHRYRSHPTRHPIPHPRPPDPAPPHPAPPDPAPDPAPGAAIPALTPTQHARQRGPNTEATDTRTAATEPPHPGPPHPGPPYLAPPF